jgi:cation diffusion facilitator family transporter
MRKSRKSIFSALLANLLIAVTKFIAGAYTNSSSMIAEGIHSVVDTINELLLLFGLHKSRKPPDKARPFGYGRELYFWSFIVSILIFGLGGGLSIFQGILHIRNPEPLKSPGWNYVVLGCSVIFEGSSLFIAAREFNKTRGELSFWKAIVKSKDPSSFLILFEDGAAVLGLIIVFILMQCSHAFQLPLLDGVASVLVGLLLIFVSLILARESHSLLIGEGISKVTQAKIRELAEKDPAVSKVLQVLSIYESPDEIILTLMVQFREGLDTEGITTAIERLRENIMREFELIRFVLIQPGRSMM